MADVLPGSMEETRMFLEGPLYKKNTIIPQVIGRLAHKKIGWQPWMNILDVDENISMPRSTDQMPNCDLWIILNIRINQSERHDSNQSAATTLASRVTLDQGSPETPIKNTTKLAFIPKTLGYFLETEDRT